MAAVRGPSGGGSALQPWVPCRARAGGCLEPWAAGSAVALPLPGRRVRPCSEAVAGAVGQVMPQVRAVDTHTLAVGQHAHIVPVDLFGLEVGLGFGFG